MFLSSPSAFGGTKDGEYYRTIEMLCEMTGKTKKEVMFMLYFLYDSQYSNKELGEMAKLIEMKLKREVK